ncbi:hypothetical protein HanXRQr2_Chr12g0561701 [Helianthus annuus]|uniref:Uncharacterized protein n=1 Tax=Helianthus annuus TaxID=4232 RepID=A0A9K3HJX6_HELAN|nr:hypothetical protein HanXRQr2_Chr12g0561701 [Helianthus annuus]
MQTDAYDESTVVIRFWLLLYVPLRAGISGQPDLLRHEHDKTRTRNLTT